MVLEKIAKNEGNFMNEIKIGEKGKIGKKISLVKRG